MKKFMILMLASVFLFGSCAINETSDKTESEKNAVEAEKNSDKKEADSDAEENTEKKTIDNENKKSKERDDYIENSSRLLPPEYYAKAPKPAESRNSELPDGRLYDPLYLDFKEHTIEQKFELIYINVQDIQGYDVTLVTEQLFNGMDDMACHIYLKPNEELPADIPNIDWYVVEKGEEIFRFATKDAYLAYRDDFKEAGSNDAPALYVGGEGLVQLGSMEEGYMIDGRKRGVKGYCMVYTYPCERGGDAFIRNTMTEEFIWNPDNCLNGYNQTEYLDNGDIISLSLKPIREEADNDSSEKYQPIFLETKNSKKEYTVQYQKADKLYTADGISKYDVNIVYEVLSHDNTLISAHIYLEEKDIVPEGMPKIDWYLREEDGQIYSYVSEEELKNYLNTNEPVRFLVGTDDKESMDYANAEVDGYYINTYINNFGDHVLVKGEDMGSMNEQSEYYWQEGKGLVNYIYSFTLYDDESKSSGSIEKINFLRKELL